MNLVGKSLGHFQVTQKIGEGGMGEVYRATDTKLGREVAVKVLPESIGKDQELLIRFEREARMLASLNHPNIATIHGFEECGQTRALVLELIEGETLTDRLKRGPIPVVDAIELMQQVAAGLEAAHDKGIIHRDLKPGNVMLTSSGHAKLMDFGIAKQFDEHAAEVDVTTDAVLTRAGALIGTPAYMSPEQVRGEKLDTRSDIFSLGVVMCEVFGAAPPFRRDTIAETAAAILNEPPQIAISAAAPLRSTLEKMIEKMLAKNAKDRPQSVAVVRHQMLDARKQSETPVTLWRAMKRPRYFVPASIVVILLTVGLALLFQNASRRRWAREVAIPEVERLASLNLHSEAFDLGRQATRVVPGDIRLQSVLEEISTEFSLDSDPAGASVSVKDYDKPDAEWTFVGVTPLRERMAKGVKRVRVELAGYEPRQLAKHDSWSPQLTLRKRNSLPRGMVEVGGGEVRPGLPAFGNSPKVQLDTFFIDRYEVTNRQFYEFVEAGGYRKQEYWKHPFYRNGERVEWSTAITEFKDQTDFPGPSTWYTGRFANGEEEFPVRGISWYEAAAYAEFAGKTLPTIYHWYAAASTGLVKEMLPLSNFQGDGSARVGQHQGMGQFGTFDMAGNVKEWCWNAADEGGHSRYVLGGGWDEPAYQFMEADAHSAISRRDNYGFRCMTTLSDSTLPKVVMGPILTSERDFSEEIEPPSAVLEAYRRFFLNRSGVPLRATIDTRDDSHDAWEVQEVSFDTPYGERVTAHLFLPKRRLGPFQCVVYHPGAQALWLKSREEYMKLSKFPHFIVMSGRALMFPSYAGTFKRKGGFKGQHRPVSTVLYRDTVIRVVQDFRRCIDYLCEREDIDSTRLAYFGTSWGGAMGPIITALEPRLAASVLRGGGLYFDRTFPEVEQITYASSVTIPTLMLNGRYDFLFPVASAQLPMYERFRGAKDHQLSDSGHQIPNSEAIKRSLRWLDEHLGSIE